MTTTTIGIEGMMCGMCEAHVNEAIRRNFNVRRVKANRRRKSCVIVSAEPLDEARLRAVIAETGHTPLSVDVTAS